MGISHTKHTAASSVSQSTGVSPSRQLEYSSPLKNSAMLNEEMMKDPRSPTARRSPITMSRANTVAYQERMRRRFSPTGPLDPRSPAVNRTPTSQTVSNQALVTPPPFKLSMCVDPIDPRSPSLKRTPVSAQDSPVQDKNTSEVVASAEIAKDSKLQTYTEVVVVEESGAVSSEARKSVTEVYSSPVELSPLPLSVSSALTAAAFSPSFARRKGKEFSPLRKSYSAPTDENAQAMSSPNKAKIAHQQARTPLSPLSQNARCVSTSVQSIKFRMDPGILG